MALSDGSNSALYGLYDLDAVDLKIIEFLRRNGRESFSKIADEIGLPASTVRDRTKRMIDSGALEIVALVNPMKAGRRVMASVGIKLAGGNHRAVANQIAELDEVTYLIICAGRFDLLVEVTCKDNAHLLTIIARLQAMPQVQYAETFVYFSIVKEVLDLGPLEL
ncbi:MAG: Lrp/AsnC family transcriptional regulator [Anaerolineae bacterium]